MLNIYFPSGRLGFGYVTGRECLCDQHTVNTLGTESLMSFPDRHFTHEMLRIVTGGIKYILREATGRGLSEACTLFLPDLPHVPAPFVAFALFPFTAIISAMDTTLY